MLLCPMCVPRKSSFSSETRHVKPPAIHTTSRYNHYGGTSPMCFGFPRVFFLLSAGTPISSFSIVSATRVTPSLSQQRITSCMCLHAIMRKYPSRIIPQHTYCKHNLATRPLSVIYHKWALHHAASAEKGLGGAEPQTILAQQGQHTPLNARWTKGKLPKRLGAGTTTRR